ncbi:DUF6597 domain-containing transcriptional factor [Rufibacter immobilis]|uniref:DUF6597 domain-containing transcriptional factor n=1 Tax=Rufibacter immobilis TaxID=1348778 RepID=UPI0035F04C90
MTYKEVKPYFALEPYIHSYWELKGDNSDRQWERIFPDGCAGLVFNAGDSCLTDNGTTVMDYGKTYVVGAMSSYKDNFIEGHTHLFGVCLKPGAFSNFYSYAPQHELTNKTIQLEKAHSFDIDKFNNNPVQYLNTFFTRRFQNKIGPLQAVLDDIHQSKGQLSVTEIAKRNSISIRQVERTFKTHIGLTLKEYANIVRFQHALSLIKSSGSKRSLLDIALECGFYDHSHLTNEIRRNTGRVPSQF